MRGLGVTWLVVAVVVAGCLFIKLLNSLFMKKTILNLILIILILILICRVTENHHKVVVMKSFYPDESVVF